MRNKIVYCGIWASALLLGGSLVPAQGPEDKPVPNGKEPVPANQLNLQPSVAQSMATIERMVEVAVQGVAARYNLNDAQRQATEEIMKRDVQKFLKDHEAEVWPLIRDLLRYQLGGKPPSDPEEVKRLGKACRPFVKLAQEAIIKGNMEWREKVLTEAQKKTHDFDMAQMERTFQDIDRNFAAWEKGDTQATAGRGLFPAQDPNAGPPRPPRPATEGLPDRLVETIVAVDTIFDTFVEQFIKEYGLDEGQVVSARSILREYKDKAADFKNSNKDDLARLTREMRETRDQRDERRRRDVEAEYKRVIQPVYEMFASMETRLRGLLNSVQMEKYNANNRNLDPTARPQERKTASAPGRSEEAKEEARATSGAGATGEARKGDSAVEEKKEETPEKAEP